MLASLLFIPHQKGFTNTHISSLHPTVPSNSRFIHSFCGNIPQKWCVMIVWLDKPMISFLSPYFIKQIATLLGRRHAHQLLLLNVPKCRERIEGKEWWWKRWKWGASVTISDAVKPQWWGRAAEERVPRVSTTALVQGDAKYLLTTHHVLSNREGKREYPPLTVQQTTWCTKSSFMM